MVSIDAGSIYVTNSTNVTTTTITDGTIVRIAATKLDYNYDNQIGAIPIPVSPGNREDKVPFSRAIDLKRIAEAITVQGFLEDESGESAITKRNNLITLGKTGGALTLVWGLSPYQTVWKSDADAETNTGVFINKMTFTETVGIIGEGVSVNPQPERNIAVQLQVIRGKDLIS